MTDWSLSYLLDGLQKDVENRLAIARLAFHHSTTKGDASETVWVELLRKYLPQRYQIGRAHIVDSDGNFSQQIDLVIYDRHYTPPMFDFSGELILPAHSVYAVFEVKQEINAETVRDALKKFSSVKNMNRKGIDIYNANTEKPAPAKEPFAIIGGILALDSKWNPKIGETLRENLEAVSSDEQLTTGCVAAHGWFAQNEEKSYTFHEGKANTTAWLFNLITLLQKKATVPAIDMAAYAKHLRSM